MEDRMLARSLSMAAVTPAASPKIEEPATKTSAPAAVANGAKAQELFLNRNGLPARLKNVNECLIATRDLIHRRVPRYLLRTPVNERVPEASTANGEADEARHRGCGDQPFTYLLVILTTTQNDTADAAPTSAASRGHHAFTVLMLLEPFNLR